MLLVCVSVRESCNYYVVYQCLLFRPVGTPRNGSAVLLTGQALMGFMTDHHIRKALPPHGGRHGVAHWSYRYCCCKLVQLPYLVFSGATVEELDVRSLVLGQVGPSH